MKGKENTAFSRVESIDMPTIITTEQLAQAQQTDEELKNILQNETRSLQLKKLSIDNSTPSFIVMFPRERFVLIYLRV